MNFDKFLDFLFHKFVGIAFAFCGALLAIFAMSSCIPLDCAGCFCETMCGEGCGDCYIDCSEDLDETCYDCFDAFSCTNNNQNGILDCLLGDGCYAECGKCYTACGGVNISCWRAVCTEGICPSCSTDYYGDPVCTYLNCVTYCGGYNGGYDDDDYYDDYYDDDDCDGCGGCNGSSSSNNGYDDYYPNNGSSGNSYYYSIELYDKDGYYYTTVSVYSNTYYLTYNSIEGYEFRGYYTQPNGGGKRITDETGYLLDKYNYTYVGYAYYQPKFTSVNVEIHKNDNYIDTVELKAGDNIEALILRLMSSEEEHRTLDAHFLCGRYSYEVYIGGSYVFGDEYFDPSRIGATNGDTVKLVMNTKMTVNIYDHNGNCSEYLVKYGAKVSELYEYAETVDGLRLLGFSFYSNGTPLDEEHVVSAGAYLYPIYSEEVKFTFIDDYGYRTDYSEANGKQFIFPIPSYTVTGKSFAGWYPDGGTLADGTYVSETSPLIGTVTLSSAFKNVTFKPIWTPNVYNVEFYVDSMLYSSATYVYGQGLTLPTNAIKDYYTFKGWSASPTGGSTVTSISTTDTGDKQFYAMFEPSQFVLRVDPVGGNVSVTSVTITYETSSGTYSFPVPTRSGYDFHGWYVNSPNGKIHVSDVYGNLTVDFKASTFGVTSVNELASLTLFADWNVETYTVQFSINDKIVDSMTQSVEHGKTATAPEIPDVLGYTFNRWMSYGQEFNFNTAITEDTVLFADLTPKNYKIVLQFSTTDDADDEFFAWAGSDGTSPYAETYEVRYKYGDATWTNWDGDVEAWHNGGKTLLGWSYNGEIVIDAEGNVLNPELLAQIPADGNGKIHLVAVWSN